MKCGCSHPSSYTLSNFYEEETLQELLEKLTRFKLSILTTYLIASGKLLDIVMMMAMRILVPHLREVIDSFGKMDAKELKSNAIRVLGR